MVRLNEKAVLLAEPTTAKDIADIGLPKRWGQRGDTGYAQFFPMVFERLTQDEQRAGRFFQKFIECHDRRWTDELQVRDRVLA